MSRWTSLANCGTSCWIYVRWRSAVNLKHLKEQGMKTIVLVALIYFALGAPVTLAQTPFYQDKTISVVLGGPPGGSADMRTRAVTTILRKHIPGNPTIIVQYMAA